MLEFVNEPPAKAVLALLNLQSQLAKATRITVDLFNDLPDGPLREAVNTMGANLSGSLLTLNQHIDELDK